MHSYLPNEMSNNPNKRNITARYTFTNCMLENTDVFDRIGNQILKVTQKYQTIKNDINLESDILKEYIEKEFPDTFNIMISTTKCVKDIDAINSISSDYLIVPDYSLNNNFEALSKLQHSKNIELLANESCDPNCRVRRIHYEQLSSFFLKEEIVPMNCPYKDYNNENYYRSNSIQSHHIKLEDMRTKYLPLGLNKFKLIGRGVSILKVVEGYVEYFVKPEYQNEIRYDFLAFLFN